jgi:hypothetical protein
MCVCLGVAAATTALHRACVCKGTFEANAKQRQPQSENGRAFSLLALFDSLSSHSTLFLDSSYVLFLLLLVVVLTLTFIQEHSILILLQHINSTLIHVNTTNNYYDY